MKTYNSHLPQIELKYKKGDSLKAKISSSRDIVEVAKNLFNTDTIEINEEVLIIFLNRQNNTIGWIRHTSGGTVGSVVDVKLILCTALGCLAQSIILLHNHPSGNIKPSKNDIDITSKLKTACQAIDLILLDSIIVNPDYLYYSFVDEGLI